MIKVLLIDDEPLARSIIAEYLEDFPEITILKECGDGFEAAKAIAELNPDLIFLDVQMPKITGFEMLELLENPPSVIFTTASVARPLIPTSPAKAPETGFGKILTA